MKSYRDLDIYNESKKLAIEIHKISLSLPKLELYEEGSQVRRSAKSVTSNIVEGYGRRRYKADYIKHLTYAQLDFLFETESLKDESTYRRLKTDYDTLSNRINKFIQWVEENLNQ